jgi:hypothetical protein
MDYFHLGLPSVLSSVYEQEVVASLRITRYLIGTWCLLSTMEWVSNLHLFRGDGLLSWRILSLRSGLFLRGTSIESIFWDSSIGWVLGIRTAAAIGLIATASAPWNCVALLAIIATSWFLRERSWLGEDGSDQMGQIASIGALLISAGIALNELALSLSGTLLIAGQLSIAYFFAGFSKLLSSDWRDGRALVGVMGTHSYGHPLGARACSLTSVIPLCLCWSVIIGETVFPLAVFASHGFVSYILAAYFLFHLSHAYLMGLNTFVWAFAAAYPSFILLSHIVTATIGLR